MKTALIVAGAALVAGAAAGTLPDAGEEHVLRVSPLASGSFEYYEYTSYIAGPSGGGREYEVQVRKWGGGAGVWGQYDATNVSYALRLGAGVITSNGTSTLIDLENEYYLYLSRRSLRPFLMPLLALSYTHSEEGGYGRSEGGGDLGLPLGLYVGARWNDADSPVFVTTGVGGKYVFLSDYEWGGWVTLRSDGYFGLTDRVALYAGVEFGRGFLNDFYGDPWPPVWRVNFNVGPSWAF